MGSLEIIIFRANLSENVGIQVLHVPVVKAWCSFPSDKLTIFLTNIEYEVLYRNAHIV